METFKSRGNLFIFNAPCENFQNDNICSSLMKINSDSLYQQNILYVFIVMNQKDWTNDFITLMGSELTTSF